MYLYLWYGFLIHIPGEEETVLMFASLPEYKVPPQREHIFSPERQGFREY
jgi:hypothetical protein